MTASAARSFGALVALTGAACRIPYVPLAPHAGAVDGTRATVEKIAEQRLGVPQLAIQVRFFGPEPPSLGDAWLAPRGSAPCQAGVRATAINPDPWMGDPHVRELVFSRDQVDRAGLMIATPTVVDVDVLPEGIAGTRRCLRLPLTEGQPHPEWVARTRWFLGAGAGSVHLMDGAYAGVGDGYLIGLYGGVWLGPVRLRLDWLFGESSTPRAPPAGYDSMTAELLGGALGVELFPFRLGAFGAGLGVGYEWLFTDFHAARGTTELDEYHFRGPRGPRAMLRLGRVPPASRWPGFTNRRDGWVMSLDLFVARWSGLGAPAATVVGIGVAVDTGYWW